MNNLKKYAINPTNEFNVLRHFKFVDDSYKETLIDQPYWYYDHTQKKSFSSRISTVDIENALITIGTKFEKNIIGIENPKKLLEIIKQTFQELLSTNKIRWIDSPEYKTTNFVFDYKFPVGKMSCLNKDNISEKDKARIKRVSRSRCVGESEVVVNIISGVEVSSTNTINVTIVEIKQLPFYTITAYPDCPSSNDILFEKLVFVV